MKTHEKTWVVYQETPFTTPRVRESDGEPVATLAVRSRAEGKKWVPCLSEAVEEAHLIAAAPDMARELTVALEIVERYVAESGPCDHDVNICVCGERRVAESMRAVLRKAGVTP